MRQVAIQGTSRGITRPPGRRYSGRVGEVVAVTTYKDVNGTQCYGGTRQIGAPEPGYVTNDQFCPPPDQFNRLTPVKVSCFHNKDGRSVPIIDTSRLFSMEYAQQSQHSNIPCR